MIGLSFDQPSFLLAIPIVLLAIILIERLDLPRAERREPIRPGRAPFRPWQQRRRSRAKRSAIVQSASRSGWRAALVPWAERLSVRRPRKATLAFGVRLLILLLVCLSLAGPRLNTAIQREAVVFDADLSASVQDQVPGEEAWIRQALATRPADDLAGIVVAGKDPLAELAVSANPGFTSFQSVPDRDWTNLASSLSLAAAMLPPDARRRVVLLSDGQQNIGDVVQQASLLRLEGVTVDTVPVAPPGGPEVRIDSLDLPTTVGDAESFSITARITSTVAESAVLRVFVDDAPASRQEITIQPGTQAVSLPERAAGIGVHRYRVQLDPTSDTLPQNNVGEGIVRVTGPPQVVVAEGHAGDGKNLASALSAEGFQVTTVAAGSLPITTDGLANYAAIVLVDVPARELGAARMGAIQTYVRDLGHGLLVIGGENSYGLGAYADTPLEQSLPVTMEIPQRKEIPTVAVALIVENLENATGNDTAKEAAKKIVAQLTPADEVMVSDASSGFPVPLQHVTDPAAIEKSIDAMQTGDPASYSPYLTGAANALINSNAKVKHIIIVGDGDAQDNYQPLIGQIVARGITVSAVATAAHQFADAATMQAVARWGRGRYYEATDFDVPAALLKEAHAVIRPAMIQDRFAPQVIGNSPLLNGISNLPLLDGYVATTSRPIASVALVSDQGDPILASWQYGLGRSVAWTSDASGLWTADFVKWPNAGQFWSRLVDWILPSPDDPSWHLNVFENGPSANIVVESDQLVNSAPGLDARIVEPDNSVVQVSLPAAGPGRYQTTFTMGKAGAYSVRVTGPSGRQPTSLEGAIVVPYSPEYRTSDANLSLLEQVARAGGGRVLSRPQEAFSEDLPPASGEVRLWRWLLAAAAVLLVVDVGIRRLNISGRDLEPALKPVRSLAAAIASTGISLSTRIPASVRPKTVPAEESPPRAASHRPPDTAREPESSTKDDPLHTTRLLAARRKRSSQRERSDE